MENNTSTITEILASEVQKLQAEAISPEKTYVTTMRMLDWVREHPEEYPELAQRSDRTAKKEITKALMKLGFVAYSAVKKNSRGTRSFARPGVVECADKSGSVPA